MKPLALLLVTFAFATALQGQHWAMALVSYCQSDNLDCQGASYSVDGKVLILSATDGAPARLTAPPTQYGLPQDWTGHDSLYLDVHVTTKAAIQLKLELIGRRSILPFQVAISDKHSLGLPLQELPLAGSSYSPVEIKISFETPGSVSIDRIYLSRKGNELRPVVDTFGQRLLQDWEGKVYNTAQLKELAASEAVTLSAIAPPDNRDQFGGWKGGPTFKGTGFFRLEKGQTTDSLTSWWLVTPEGHPFWSLGVTGLRSKYPWSDVTPFKDRIHLFQALPPQFGPAKTAYEGTDHVSFFTWNIIRKWGSVQQWRRVSFERLQRWGMNTLGNWASDAVLEETPLPYTRALRSNSGTATKLRLGQSTFPDVFDAEWAFHLDTLFSNTAQWKADPLLLGYFVDNEMHWNDPLLLENAEENRALRAYWVKQLKGKYENLEELNKSWGTKINSWEEAEKIHQDFPTTEGFQSDLLRLEKDFAERYFQLIAQTLAKYDPNHLFLGCRFTRKLKPGHVIESAGKWADLISINVYSYAPEKEEMESWHKLSGGRPILIGEHHVPLDSKRQLPPKYPNFTSAERHEYYLNYVQTWAKMPFAVGCHWYQFKDQSLTGRGTIGGENQTIGLVDITDQPHQPLIDAVRKASRQMYIWHHSVTQ